MQNSQYCRGKKKKNIPGPIAHTAFSSLSKGEGVRYVLTHKAEVFFKTERERERRTHDNATVDKPTSVTPCSQRIRHPLFALLKDLPSISTTAKGWNVAVAAEDFTPRFPLRNSDRCRKITPNLPLRKKMYHRSVSISPTGHHLLHIDHSPCLHCPNPFCAP